MSDTAQGQEEKPTRRSKRWFGRIAALVGFACVVGLFAALTLWVTQPRWYTFVSRPFDVLPIGGIQSFSVPPERPLGKAAAKRLQFALSIRVPFGWECSEWRPASNLAVHPFNMIQVNIHRKALVGLAQWWYQYILRRNTVPQPSEICNVVLWAPTDDYNDPGQYLRTRQPFLQRTFYSGPAYRYKWRTFPYPLGSALQVTASSFALPGAAAHSVRWFEVTYIVLDQPSRHHQFRITGSHLDLTPHSDGFHTTWDEIVRSIRVVQK